MKKNILASLVLFLISSFVFAQQTEKLPRLTAKEFTSQVWDFKKSKKKFVYTGNTPMIIDFYADWCKPCKEVYPILLELQAEYGDRLSICQMNVDKNSDYEIDRELDNLSDFFNLEKIPALLFVRGNGDTKTYFLATGKKSKQELKSIIEKVIFKE